MVLLYGSSLVELLLNVALFWLLFFRKEKLQRECLVVKEEKAVIREENQKREYYVYYKSYMSVGILRFILFCLQSHFLQENFYIYENKFNVK